MKYRCILGVLLLAPINLTQAAGDITALALCCERATMGFMAQYIAFSFGTVMEEKCGSYSAPIQALVSLEAMRRGLNVVPEDSPAAKAYLLGSLAGATAAIAFSDTLLPIKKLIH